MSDTQTPQHLKYSSTHEWLEVDGEHARVGITDHAQHQLGDIVFVELPEVGDEIERGDEVAVVESVKTAADIYAPVSGKVIAVNTALAESPALVNQAAFADGWLYQVQMAAPKELDELLDHAAYADKLAE